MKFFFKSGRVLFLNEPEECLDCRTQHSNLKNFLGSHPQQGRGVISTHTLPWQCLWCHLVGFVDSFPIPSWLNPPPLSKTWIHPCLFSYNEGKTGLSKIVLYITRLVSSQHIRSKLIRHAAHVSVTPTLFLKGVEEIDRTSHSQLLSTSACVAQARLSSASLQNYYYKDSSRSLKSQSFAMKYSRMQHLKPSLSKFLKGACPQTLPQLVAQHSQAAVSLKCTPPPPICQILDVPLNPS